MFKFCSFPIHPNRDDNIIQLTDNNSINHMLKEPDRDLVRNLRNALDSLYKGTYFLSGEVLRSHLFDGDKKYNVIEIRDIIALCPLWSFSKSLDGLLNIQDDLVKKAFINNDLKALNIHKVSGVKNGNKSVYAIVNTENEKSTPIELTLQSYKIDDIDNSYFNFQGYDTPIIKK